MGQGEKIVRAEPGWAKAEARDPDGCPPLVGADCATFCRRATTLQAYEVVLPLKAAKNPGPGLRVLQGPTLGMRVLQGRMLPCCSWLAPSCPGRQEPGWGFAGWVLTPDVWSKV